VARPNAIKERAQELGIKPDLLVAKALRQGRTIQQAHDIIGVSYQSLWRYVNDRPELFKHDCGWNYLGNEIDAEIVDDPHSTDTHEDSR
jgi:hypothetical protein